MIRHFKNNSRLNAEKASVVSDAGILLKVWWGPIILLRHDALRDLPLIAQTYVPLSVLSAIAISGESLFDGAST